MRVQTLVLAALSWLGAGRAQGPPPTYTAQVADILDRHCTGCHHRGGIGRLPLDSYEQARAFSTEIRNTANNRQMPPLFAVPGYGEFRNERGLSLSEIQTLIRWSDEGKLLGDAPLPPATRPSRDTWRIGQPDLILTTPAIQITGSGGRESRCFLMKTDLRSDMGVRVIDVLPSDRRMVYQVRLFALPKPLAKVDSADCEQAMREEDRIRLGEWAPHLDLDPLPTGWGRALPRGGQILVEVTYQKIGVPVSVSSTIGVYFQPATRYIQTKAVLNQPLVIPAGEWNYGADASWALEEDITLISIWPHMHRLGMEMRVNVRKPDGSKETLLWVRDYDEMRQKAYTLKSPKLLPKGSRLEVTGYFNNSESNTRLGREATHPGAARDEVLIAHLEYLEEGR